MYICDCYIHVALLLERHACVNCKCIYIIIHIGGGYSFMQADMNEDSSTTNIQDFFSQFGKTDTSSNTEGAGIVL